MYIYEHHMGGLYISDSVLDHDETYCEQCGDSDWLVGYANTGEDAWNLLKYDTDIGGSGGWNYDYVREFIIEYWGFDIDKREDDDFDPFYEDENMKFIWGVKSWDDLTDADVCLHTMNDIDLIYLKDKKKYILGIETIFEFEKEEHKINYLKSMLCEFEKFMVENGYNTELKPSWWNVFGKGISEDFDSIEECYAMFKFLVNGYCKT